MNTLFSHHQPKNNERQAAEMAFGDAQTHFNFNEHEQYGFECEVV